MARRKQKYYVVINGFQPGIYESWPECQEQVVGYPRAVYKSFDSMEDAVKAFRDNPDGDLSILRNIAQHQVTAATPVYKLWEKYPEINPNGIAVDAACSSNPGPVEYQGVRIGTGERLFRIGPFPGGTNNIGEYIAIVHAAALLEKQGDFTTPIYSDSATALSWIKRRQSKTTVIPTEHNQKIMELLRRADIWAATHIIRNPLIKWKTEQWGEIPADFGRK